VIISFAQPNKKYFIAFKDKVASTYSVSQPQQFLTQKALDRRAKYNIAITEQDLPVNATYVQQVTAVGVTIWGVSKWLNGVIITTNNPTFLTTINQLPFVKTSVDVMRKANVNNNKFENFNSLTQRAYQVFDSSYYGSGAPAVRQLNLAPLHNSGFTGESTLIAVMDAGFPSVNTLSVFDSINQQNKIVYTYDVVLNQAFVYANHGHGTAVLSCIASNKPNSFVGTGFGANIALIRTEDAPTENIVEEYYWAIGAEKADSIGADVITSSLGYTVFDNPLVSHVYANMNGKTAVCSQAATIAASKGIIVCVAAGNEGSNAWHYISAPADADSICTVGAVGINGVIAGFSSVGPTPDGRIKPTLMANGLGKAVADEFGNIVNANGTSFACPTLAGAIACLAQKFPLLKPQQIIDAVKASATLAQSPNNNYGWGIPNFGLASFLLSDTNNKSKNETKIYGTFSNENDLQIYFIKAKEIHNTIALYDFNGKLLMQTKITLNTQYDELTLPLSQALTSGTYILSIKGKTTNTTIKLFK
jgi:serine protease AprX